MEKENLAPRARFELATLRLTAECSTIELPGNGTGYLYPIVANYTPYCSSAMRVCSLHERNKPVRRAGLPALGRGRQQ
jgi:hypothetical protein